MIRMPLTFFLIGKDITAKMNDLRVGGMVRLVNPSGSNEWNVSVYFRQEDQTLEHGRLPVNSIGMIIDESCHAGVYTVLFGDRTIITSDTYIKAYHGEELFMPYAEYEGYISDMESSE